MTRFFKFAVATAALLMTQACIPTQIYVEAPGKKLLSIQFYPGGETLPDLLVINGENYYGKAQYQWDDPLADIGFRFVDGRRVRAECLRSAKDILGMEQCALYEVYRSDFDLIPEGIQAPNPTL